MEFKEEEDTLMKRFLALFLAMLMLLALAAGCTKDDPPADDDNQGGDVVDNGGDSDVIKIGIFEPLSGANAAGGQMEYEGIQVAHSLKGEVLGKKIELVAVDNKSDDVEAVNAAVRLVDSEKVDIVIGSWGSSVAIAAGSTFESAQVPAIGTSCTNPNVTLGNDYYFRVCFLDPFQGSVMASFAMEEFGAKKAYVLSMLGDDYTVGLAKNFVIAFEAAGGEIVADETFVEGTADFSAYLNNAVAGGADVIFAPSAIAYAPQIIEQASALGISLPILGGDTWENSAISDAQNGTDMQVFVSTFFDENDESGLAKEFVTGYKAWLNGNSQNLTNNGGNDVVAAVSALGYDAYMTAVAAIEKAQSTDGSAIRDALAGLSIDAVTGSISFDANGDAIKSTAYIKQAIDGGFQFYKVQNAD